MDKINRQIFQHLQENAAQPVADIARKVDQSVTPCWHRIQWKEESGVIRQLEAPLDAQKFGVGMSIFVAISTDQQNADWPSQFATMVSAMPEVMKF